MKNEQIERRIRALVLLQALWILGLALLSTSSSYAQPVIPGGDELFQLGGALSAALSYTIESPSEMEGIADTSERLYATIGSRLQDFVLQDDGFLTRGENDIALPDVAEAMVRIGDHLYLAFGASSAAEKAQIKIFRIGEQGVLEDAGSLVLPASAIFAMEASYPRVYVLTDTGLERIDTKSPSHPKLLTAVPKRKFVGGVWPSVSRRRPVDLVVSDQQQVFLALPTGLHVLDGLSSELLPRRIDSAAATALTAASGFVFCAFRSGELMALDALGRVLSVEPDLLESPSALAVDESLGRGQLLALDRNGRRFMAIPFERNLREAAARLTAPRLVPHAAEVKRIAIGPSETSSLHLLGSSVLVALDKEGLITLKPAHHGAEEGEASAPTFVTEGMATPHLPPLIHLATDHAQDARNGSPNIAYASAGQAGLYVLELASLPSQPRRLDRIQLIESNSGKEIFDLDGLHPEMDSYEALSVIAAADFGEFLAVLTADHGLLTLDWRSRTLLGSWPDLPPGGSTDLIRVGQWLYFVGGDGRMHIFDLEDPRRPNLQSIPNIYGLMSLALVESREGSPSAAGSQAKKPRAEITRYLLATGSGALNAGQLFVFALREPKEPQLIASLDLDTPYERISVMDGRIYLSGRSNSLIVLNANTLEHPEIHERFEGLRVGRMASESGYIAAAQSHDLSLMQWTQRGALMPLAQLKLPGMGQYVSEIGTNDVWAHAGNFLVSRGRAGLMVRSISDSGENPEPPSDTDQDGAEKETMNVFFPWLLRPLGAGARISGGCEQPHSAGVFVDAQWLSNEDGGWNPDRVSALDGLYRALESRLDSHGIPLHLGQYDHQAEVLAKSRGEWARRKGAEEFRVAGGSSAKIGIARTDAARAMMSEEGSRIDLALALGARSAFAKQEASEAGAIVLVGTGQIEKRSRSIAQDWARKLKAEGWRIIVLGGPAAEAEFLASLGTYISSDDDSGLADSLALERMAEEILSCP